MGGGGGGGGGGGCGGASSGIVLAARNIQKQFALRLELANNTLTAESLAICGLNAPLERGR